MRYSPTHRHTAHAGENHHDLLLAGGDCWSNYESMEESLWGGLSLTSSGFGFWSHDIGGFEATSTPDVYKRWCVSASRRGGCISVSVSSGKPWRIALVHSGLPSSVSGAEYSMDGDTCVLSGCGNATFTVEI